MCIPYTIPMIMDMDMDQFAMDNLLGLNHMQTLYLNNNAVSISKTEHQLKLVLNHQDHYKLNVLFVFLTMNQYQPKKSEYNILFFIIFI